MICSDVVDIINFELFISKLTLIISGPFLIKLKINTTFPKLLKFASKDE